MTNSCSIEGCLNGGKLRRGWCSLHYNRWRAGGDPLITKQIHGDDESRFLSYVDKTSECLLWTGSTNHKGYGLFRIGGKMVSTHRWAYEHYIGPIPSGLQLDHLCMVRNCVNPDHLEPVTARENIHRSLISRGYVLALV